MVSVFLLPLLSVLYYYLSLLWEQHMGSSSSTDGAGSKTLTDEERRARDIAEEQAIKNSAV